MILKRKADDNSNTFQVLYNIDHYQILIYMKLNRTHCSIKYIYNDKICIFLIDIYYKYYIENTNLFIIYFIDWTLSAVSLNLNIIKSEIADDHSSYH